MSVPSNDRVGGIMSRVCLALIPGIAALTYVWGLGVLWNLGWIVGVCLGLECLIALLQKKPLLSHVADRSALVTAILIGICLPPFTAVHVHLVAGLVAIGLAKHAYGGIGRNIFNPAMVGYAAILVSFPAALSHWPQADTDALTGATLLSEFRYRTGVTTDEFIRHHAAATAAQKLIATAFLIGGGILIFIKLIHWRIPAAVFAGVGLGALFGYDQGASTSLGGWFFHLTAGGTVAAAFFVATDPVSHPQRTAHQWIFGGLVGLLIYAIRAFGAYPDGIAFAILLANCATPLLDRQSRQVQGTTSSRGVSD